MGGLPQVTWGKTLRNVFLQSSIPKDECRVPDSRFHVLKHWGLHINLNGISYYFKRRALLLLYHYILRALIHTPVADYDI